MDYRVTEVFSFFLSLKQYAFGDLDLFHRASKDAEDKEIETASQGTPVQNSTKYPYDFSFKFGTPQPSRGTVPFTLMMFSCIDILGYLVRESARHQDTKGNIEAFFKCLDLPPTDSEINLLVNIYRHGLSHTYFPKFSQAISYHSTNPDSLFFVKRETNTLNVNKLEKYFEKGFEKIVGSVDKYDLFNSNFERLLDYYKQHDQRALHSIG